MAILNTNFSYTYNGTLLSEVMYKPSVETPSLSDLFRIIPGSDQKIQIPTVGIMEKVLKAGGNCVTTDTGSGINIENQTVTVDKIRMRLTQCAEDFEGSVGSILSEQWLKDGVDINDISGTELQRTIDRLLEDAIRRDLFRLASFGDKADADTDYNFVDGLWKVLIAGVGTDINRAATLGTGALSAGEALAALKSCYEDADPILDRSKATFVVTRSVLDNLVTSYESISTGSDLQVSWQVDGIPNVRYRGVPVKEVPAWDVMLQDAANPLNTVADHLILYTVKENHVLGVQNASDLNRIKGWYSDDDDNYKFAAKMRMGYNYVHPDMTVIAY